MRYSKKHLGKKVETESIFFACLCASVLSKFYWGLRNP